MKLPTSLIAELKHRRVVLFAGAGLSATLGLPSWSCLIAKMASDLEFDTELFKMLGGYPSLAEYYLVQKPCRGAFAKWLRCKWHIASIDIIKSQAYRALVKANFPIIYTTNYDHLIEKAHCLHGVPVSKIVHGDDIRVVSSDSVQIVKFHGDLDYPDTMVVTETDYFERLRFEAALDLKLRADLLRYSVIFVGYSLSDLNIRNMLYRLSLLRKEHMSCRGSWPRSYIFLDRRNEVQTTIFERWGIDTILSDVLDRREGLDEFMSAVANECA